MADSPQRFPTTHWSVVIAAQGAPTPNARLALERLFETYWYPVYAFIRNRTGQAADAEDLTQGFFAGLLDPGSLDSVRPELGRFRAFLLASAKHYLSAERARARTQKRGGGAVSLPLDFASADSRYRLEASLDENPEVQFERQWARAAFEAAGEKLRQEFATGGKAIQFEAFRQYLTAGDEPASYADVAAGLEMTEAAVKVAVHRARRRFGRLLREQIAETVAADGAEPVAWERAVEDEVAYLFRILGS
ncbi:MAG: sigma-70 family RNA polymerase sigma factor [Acidobacteriia bacterium]|nr:sigma-70 family RNA polymerase sigma factor [Terriglobia bacterium]